MLAQTPAIRVVAKRGVGAPYFMGQAEIPSTMDKAGEATSVIRKVRIVAIR